MTDRMVVRTTDDAYEVWAVRDGIPGEARREKLCQVYTNDLHAVTIRDGLQGAINNGWDPFEIDDTPEEELIALLIDLHPDADVLLTKAELDRWATSGARRIIEWAKGYGFEP